METYSTIPDIDSNVLAGVRTDTINSRISDTASKMRVLRKAMEGQLNRPPYRANPDTVREYQRLAAEKRLLLGMKGSRENG